MGNSKPIWKVWIKNSITTKPCLFMLSNGNVISEEDYYNLDSGNKQEIAYYLALEDLKSLPSEDEQLKRITKTVFSLSGVKYKRIPADENVACTDYCELKPYCDELEDTKCSYDKSNPNGYIFKILQP